MKIFTAKRLKIISALSMILISTSVFTYDYGPPAGKTNAPGESNCTNCHSSYSLITSGTVWNGISLTTNMPGGGYSPNGTYTCTVSISYSGIPRYGFQLCVLSASAISSSTSLGTLIVTDSLNQQLQTSSGRQYLNHTDSGYFSSTGSASWSFNWQAPSSNQGSVKFYLVVNATNNDYTSSGDEILAKTFTFSALPVQWISVNASQKDNSVLLKWSTASEINNNHFEVERSLDGNNFSMVGNLKANGNTTVVSTYLFEDNFSAAIQQNNSISSQYYYRIRQVDNDGKSSFSNVVVTNYSPKKVLLTLLPNPVVSEIVLINNNQTISPLNWSVYNINGEKVIDGILDNYSRSLDVSQLDKGIYFLMTDGEKPIRFLKM